MANLQCSVRATVIATKHLVITLAGLLLEHAFTSKVMWNIIIQCKWGSVWYS